MSLVHDRLGAGLGFGGVGRVAAAGIKPHAGDRGDFASMNIEPRIAELVDFGDVRGHVVVELVAAPVSKFFAYPLNDPLTCIGVTRDHAIIFGVDDCEVETLLAGNPLAHPGDRCQESPHGPTNFFELPVCSPPHPSDRIEGTGQFAGVEPALVDLPAHRVHVGPGPERKE